MLLKQQDTKVDTPRKHAPAQEAHSQRTPSDSEAVQDEHEPTPAEAAKAVRRHAKAAAKKQVKAEPEEEEEEEATPVKAASHADLIKRLLKEKYNIDKDIKPRSEQEKKEEKMAAKKKKEDKKEGS